MTEKTITVELSLTEANRVYQALAFEHRRLASLGKGWFSQADVDLTLALKQRLAAILADSATPPPNGAPFSHPYGA